VDVVDTRCVKDILPLPDGKHALVIYQGSNQIWKTNLESGKREVYAGMEGKGHKDGMSDAAQFHNPTSLAFKSDGSVVVLDERNHVIREISFCGKYVATIAGYTEKVDVLEDSSYINARVSRKIINGQVSTIAGQPGVGGYKDEIMSKVEEPLSGPINYEHYDKSEEDAEDLETVDYSEEPLSWSINYGQYNPEEPLSGPINYGEDLETVDNPEEPISGPINYGQDNPEEPLSGPINYGQDNPEELVYSPSRSEFTEKPVILKRKRILEDDEDDEDVEEPLRKKQFSTI
jgi:hypothetical protein